MFFIYNEPIIYIMATIIKMLRALREATGNIPASDAFMEALEERERQREAQREREARKREREARKREQEAREREAQHEARTEKLLAAMRSEIRVMNWWFTIIGLLIAFLAVAVTLSGLN